MAEAADCRWMPAPLGVACASVTLDQVAAGVPNDGPPDAPLAAMLSDEERMRFGQLRIRKRRIEWLAGRIAAKHALQRLGGGLARDATVRLGADGRPAVHAHRLSISHSRRDAMAAAARMPVGVDTETFDAMRADSLGALIRPSEAQALRRDLGCDPQVARTLAWCLKEALFKATGSGAFAPFAAALQLLGWSAGLARPSWRWDIDHAPPGAPLHEAWQARFGVGRDAAWVLVAPATTSLD